MPCSELGAVWMTLRPAASLGLAEATSSRNLTVKLPNISTQGDLIFPDLLFSINSGHRGMNLPFDGFHPRWRPIKHHDFCRAVPRYPFYVCVVPVSLRQATRAPLEGYLCQLRESRLCFLCVRSRGQLAQGAICIMRLVPGA